MKLGHKFVMDVRVTGCNDWRCCNRLRVVSDDLCQALDSVEGSYRMFVSCVGQLTWKTSGSDSLHLSSMGEEMGA